MHGGRRPYRRRSGPNGGVMDDRNKELLRRTTAEKKVGTRANREKAREIIVRFVRDNPRMTYQEVSEVFGLHPVYLNRIALQRGARRGSGRRPSSWAKRLTAVAAETWAASRADVYDAIDSEREYQGSLPRNDVKNQTPMEHLAIIERVVGDMKDAWYDNPGQPPMDYMRKIAAVAVRCMEQHGAPRRAA